MFGVCFFDKWNIYILKKIKSCQLLIYTKFYIHIFLFNKKTNIFPTAKTVLEKHNLILQPLRHLVSNLKRRQLRGAKMCRFCVSQICPDGKGLNLESYETLPETNMWTPENVSPLEVWRFLLETIIFRGELLVSGRVWGWDWNPQSYSREGVWILDS